MSTITSKIIIFLAFLAFNIDNVQAFGVVPSTAGPKSQALFVSTTTSMMEEVDAVFITNVSPSTTSASSPSYEECMTSFVQRHVTIGVASLMAMTAVVMMMGMHS